MCIYSCQYVAGQTVVPTTCPAAEAERMHTWYFFPGNDPGQGGLDMEGMGMLLHALTHNVLKFRRVLLFFGNQKSRNSYQ